VGRLKEGTVALARAHALDPLSPMITANLGRPYWCLRQYDTALTHFRRAVDLEPDLWLGHGFLAWTLTDVGAYDEAAEAARVAIARSAGNASAVLALADAHAAAGDRVRALEGIESVVSPQGGRGRYVSSFRVARVFARLGDRDRAFEWLDRSYEERSLGSTSFLLHDPALDSIRCERRFAFYLKALGLPRATVRRGRRAG
jgi:tetratricopeptide (TPR) repeat protein